MSLTKNILFAASIVTAATGIYATSTFAPANLAHAADTSKVKLDTEAGKLGYTFGMQIASDMKRQNLQDDIDVNAMFAAFEDVFGEKDLRLTDEQMREVQAKFQQTQQDRYQATLAEGKAKGEAYLAKNAKKSGVVTTDSGLQYEILREGKGSKPGTTDTIKVHYTGTLTDGTKFDSSYDRGAPADFPVTGVIPGFSEGLQLMEEGGKYRFTIPSELAYGEQGPASIGPNQVLVFEVELIEILTQSTTKKASE